MKKQLMPGTRLKLPQSHGETIPTICAAWRLFGAYKRIYTCRSQLAVGVVWARAAGTIG
jgi:hypothetical protein